MAAMVFSLYAVTLAPTVAFWDAGDYITAAHVLGIPHPPGNPLFVLMASTWEWLLAPTGLSTAVRINLFSAFMSAGAAFFWFLVAHRILAFVTQDRVVRVTGAVAAVTVSATAFTVWNHSNVNEKVYTVSLFTVALLTWLAFRWRDRVESREGGGATRMEPVLLMVFVLALSVGNHLMAFLAAPAIGVFLLSVRPRLFREWRLYVFAALIGVVGLSVHLYLPIRAGLDPVMNEASPTCESVAEALVSVVSFGRAGCEDLSAALSREQYAKPPVTTRLAPIGAQIANYVQYFDWQWARSLGGREAYFSPARLPVTLLFLCLGLLGAWTHRRADRRSFAYVAVLFGTLSLALVFYMNFKYGFGQAQALGLPVTAGEVRERDYFFLISFSVWGIWVGIAIAELWARLGERLRASRHGLVLASPVLLLALIPLTLNWSYATRSGDTLARDFATHLLQSVEPYGVLLTAGDNDTLPLWYAQEVEGIRKDVTVVSTQYLNAAWYAMQLRDLTHPCAPGVSAADDPTRILCQRPFDPAGAPAFYADRAAPEDSILPFGDAEIRATAGIGIVLPQALTFEAHGIRVELPRDTFLTPADQFTLAIIRRAGADRPLHFASPSPIETHRRAAPVARHGLTYRLVLPERTDGLLPMPRNEPNAWTYGAYLDRERTHRLLWDEFDYGNVFERRVWVDDATRNIPMYYVFAHVALARAEELSGDASAAAHNVGRAERWMEVASR
jgi:hypothetical protein